MVVRVDTTNITRGLDFSVFVQADTEPTVKLYAFNSATHDVDLLSFTIEKSGILFKVNSKAPYFDGYLLATIDNKSLIVKKIGHPRPHFVIGYKSNYTVPYELIDERGVTIVSSNLIPITDGFYYCEVPESITIMKTLGKQFIMKDNITKLNYMVRLGDSTLSDVNLPNYTLDATTLNNVVLSDVVLDNIDINATLPSVEITEY